jgi:flagellin
MAIATRMGSQISGQNQAIRNANDGISLSQTAQGAMQSIVANLQTMRSLAVQASNATYSASDRASMNAEVLQLKSEIDRVAASTTFNGVNLLDGSFTAKNFQVGANNTSNDVIQVAAIGNMQTTSLQSDSSTVAGNVTTAALNAGDLTLNGYQVGASQVFGAPGQTADSAFSIAQAIDGVSSKSGVNAIANATTLTGTGPTSFTAVAANTFSINGFNVGAIAAGSNAAGQGANAAAAINLISAQTGVTAAADAVTGALTLTASDGRNINIGMNGTASTLQASYTNVTALGAQLGLSATQIGTQALTVNTGAIDAASSNQALGGATPGTLAGGAAGSGASTIGSGSLYVNLNNPATGNSTGNPNVDIGAVSLSAAGGSIAGGTALTTTATSAIKALSASTVMHNLAVTIGDGSKSETISIGDVTLGTNAATNAANLATAINAALATVGGTGATGSVTVGTGGLIYTGGATAGLLNGAFNSASDKLTTMTLALGGVAENSTTATSIQNAANSLFTGAETWGTMNYGGAVGNGMAVADALSAAMYTASGDAASGVPTAYASTGGTGSTSAGVVSYTYTAGAVVSSAGLVGTAGTATVQASGAAGTTTTVTGATTITGATNYSVSLNAGGGVNTSTLATQTGFTTAQLGVQMTAAGPAQSGAGTIAAGTFFANGQSVGAITLNAAVAATAATTTVANAASFSVGYLSGSAAGANTGQINDLTVKVGTGSVLNLGPINLTGNTTKDAATIAAAINAQAAGTVSVTGNAITNTSGSGLSFGLGGTSQNATTAASDLTAAENVLGLSSSSYFGSRAYGGAAGNGIAIANAITTALAAATGGAAVNGRAVSDANGVVSIISGTSQTLLTMPTTLNAAQLMAAQGALSAQTGFSTTQLGGNAASAATAVATRGSVSLTSSSASGINIGGNAAASAGFTMGATVATATSAVSSVDVTTQTNASNAIAAIDGAINTVNTAMGLMGAVQNRFQSVVTNLQTGVQNLTAAQSRIQDTDFAATTASLTQAQILQQAGTAMLAQANAMPNAVLTLLK